MKKDSYAFLIPLIVGGLTLIFGFVVWSIEIYRVTFLTALGEQYLAAVSLLLPLVAMEIAVRGRKSMSRNSRERSASVILRDII